MKYKKHVVKDDGVRVYVDWGKTQSYDYLELYKEGFIGRRTLMECERRQNELDKQPF